MLNVLVQFVSFALVGAFGTAVHYGVLMAGREAFGLAPVAAATLGALCGAVINYFLNYHVTFRCRSAHAITAAKFLAVAAVGIVLNALVVGALTYAAGLHYLLAQVGATGVVLAWGFLANRAWTFAT